MGREEDDIAANHNPPKTPDEWRAIRSGVDKAHKSWVIVGPIHAVVTNWRALALILAIVLYLNRPDIVAALRVLTGRGE